jgi:hypothetical protein
MIAPANGQRAVKRVEIYLQTPCKAREFPSFEKLRVSARFGGCCADLP